MKHPSPENQVIFFGLDPAGRFSIKKPQFIPGAGFENTGCLKLIAGKSPDKPTRKNPKKNPIFPKVRSKNSSVQFIGGENHRM